MSKIDLLTNYKKSLRAYWQIDNLLGASSVPGDTLTTNNGIMLTALYFLLKYKLCIQEARDQEDFNRKINEQSYPGFPGLFYKSKLTTDLMASHDDLIAAACVSSLYDGDIARRIYAHGKKVGWSFDHGDASSFSLRRWHGRFLYVVSHYKHCAGVKLDLVDFFFFYLMIITKLLFSKGESGKQLAWFMVEAVRGKYAMLKPAVWLFDKSINLYEMFSRYHGLKHPFAIFTEHLRRT